MRAVRHPALLLLLLALCQSLLDKSLSWFLPLSSATRGKRCTVRAAVTDATAETEEYAVSPAWADIASSSPYKPEMWEEETERLGRGAFGIVNRGVNKETGELVAMKRIAPTIKLAIATAKNEIDAAEALGEHPNIVQMKAYFLAPENHDGGGGHRDMMLVYRLALNGDLQNWIHKQHGTSFSPVDFASPMLTDESLRIMLQLTEGLEFVHSKNVQHRDLTPPNILLSAGATPIIADFGIALVDRNSSRKPGDRALGDFYFIDVDSLVVKQLPYGLEDDIYSLGEVFVRILYGSYATGSELRRFVEKSQDGAPIVTRILASMLNPRESRSTLAEVRDQLRNLGFQPVRSQPRPIVTSAFLGIGAVVTAAVIAQRERTRSLRRSRSVFSSRSRLRAEFCVGRANGKRNFMEDYYCHSRVAFNYRPGARSWRLLGVFDGHGGKDCAKFAARFLPHEVRRMLRSAEEDLAGTIGDTEDPGQVSTSETGTWPSARVMHSAAEALLAALESLNLLYVKFREKRGSSRGFGYAATTAAAALLSPDGSHAVLCNIGDARAALAGDWRVTEHFGYEPIVSPEGDVVLTRPHTPGDPSEIQRIESAGGFVELGARGHRVNGALGVSRAIGYAGVAEFANTVPASADYIIAERDASAGRTGYVSLVALATDGVFEGVGQDQAAAVCRRLAEADDGASLGEKIQAELDTAGGGPGKAEENEDNATLLTCLLPAL